MATTAYTLNIGREVFLLHVIKRTSAGLQALPMDSVLLSKRKVFLTGEITPESADSVIQQLLYLEDEGKTEPIDLIINSPGGSVSAGLMVYDQLRGMRDSIQINSYCSGFAGSMAAIILAGGQHGHRFILPHAKVMIHEPLIAGGVGGSATSIQRTAASIMETKRITIDLLAQDTGRSVEEIEKAISYDNTMNAEEAISFGICDRIAQRV